MGSDIEVRIDELLKKHKRSFYWLSKETGISYTTLWRLKKGKALGINFATLKKLCVALGCGPGDLMKFSGKSKSERVEHPHSGWAQPTKEGSAKKSVKRN